MKVVGIDPGLDGALAWFEDGMLAGIDDIPTIRPAKRRLIDEIDLARIIDAAGPIAHAFIEYVGPQPKEGAVGAFSFGYGYGVLHGILRAHFVPVHRVTPQRWKRAHGISAGSGKEASRWQAKSRWQQHAGLFTRVKDSGRAEAALIGDHGIRHVLPARAKLDDDLQRLGL